MSSAGLKIKFRRGDKTASKSPQPGSAPSPRKKRRVSLFEEDAEERPVRQRKRTIREDAAEDNEDYYGFFDDARDASYSSSPLSKREETPEAAPVSPTSKHAAPAVSRRSNKKKAKTVYSDEDADLDDEFAPASPPSRKPKKGTAAAKGKTKGGKAGASVGIAMKDERKIVKPPNANADMGADGKTAAAKILVGLKRRREGEEQVDILTESDTLVSAQSNATLLSAPSEATLAPSQPQSSKIKKLPTIKKNKALAVGGNTSGTSTPTATPVSKPSLSALGIPVNASLPRKPAATLGGADVDLSNSEVYKSLFNTTGSMTPRVGTKGRSKEEERRKELEKMRDEARAARMEFLKRNAFDLVAGQEKIARFESHLKARNSKALFPHHLAAYFKDKKS